MSNFEQNLSENVNSENSKRKKKSILGKITQHMDLDLLRDSRYVAVILGNTAEKNYLINVAFITN